LTPGMSIIEGGGNLVACDLGTCTCPLCQTSADSDSDYFARAFGEPRRFAATGEAVSDALGFCPRHGASLLSQERWSDGVSHVLREAVPRLALMLNEKHLHEPHVQHALFGADGACPACTYANRAVGRQAASLARQLSGAEEEAGLGFADALCFGHFQLLAGNLAPEPRLAALTGYLDPLQQTARKMKALLRRDRETDPWSLDDGAETLNRALDLIAGRPMFESGSTDGKLADALSESPPLVEAIAFPDICPLCVETERARKRWLQNVQRAADFDLDAWLFLPTCPEHLWAVARLETPGLTAAVVAHTLSVALRYARSQIHALVRAAELREEEARIKAEGPEVWAAHKRKRTRQKTEEQKNPVPRLAKCSGCERLEIAAERTTGNLLDMLHEKKYRDDFSRGYGLCLKHFARAYRIAPRGIVRSLLAEDQQGRLAEIAGSLDECGDALWKTALRRFCGFA
jgi:hypothetical protein